MPSLISFPFLGPNRRSDRRVVELRLDMAGKEWPRFDTTDPMGVLRQAGLSIEAGAPVPSRFPDDPPREALEALTALALVLQQQAGHALTEWVTRPTRDGRSVAWVEHEDAETGMAAVRLAAALLSGRAGDARGAIDGFLAAARQRRLADDSRALIAVAEDRGVPWVQMDRPPLAEHLRSAFRVRPNGWLRLGHGRHHAVMDGTFWASRANEAARRLLRSPQERQAMLQRLGLAATTGPVTDTTDRLVIGKHRWVVSAREPGSDDEAGLSASLAALASALAPLPFLARASRTTEGRWAVQDFDLAPDLGRLSPELRQVAANALLELVLPDAQLARVPMAAITGTNGKTTTSRMLAHILRTDGRRPGLVCTDGIQLGGQWVNAKDAGTILGHLRVLTSAEADVAVLETHNRGIAVRGFAFQRCDVGVCLNVSDDHIVPGEIESVEEMARVKGALVERAGHLAVLFADNAWCRDMVARTPAQHLGLVSLEQDTASLQAMGDGRPVWTATLEARAGEDWLVLGDAGPAQPLMRVTDLPSAFGGAARFNIANALHASLAARGLGVSNDVIARALSGFRTGTDTTPGRLNVFDQLPFRVILDFAHNPDGLTQICDFMRALPVEGRRILAFAVTWNRTSDMARNMARVVAGEFDVYFCKEYPPRDGGPQGAAAPILRKELLNQGLPEDQVRLESHGRAAAFRIFDFCQPGDTLLFLGGTAELPLVPGWVADYAKRAG